jgi:hypothetical protein
MDSWRKHLELSAQAKLGLGYGVFAWALIAMVFAIAGFGFILLSAFIWLAKHYDPLTAAVVLAIFFVLAALLALTLCLWLHRRIIQCAQLALATHRSAPWFDAMFLGTAVEVGRSLGWRKTAPLLALGVLATGVALQWASRNRSDAEVDNDSKKP